MNNAIGMLCPCSLRTQENQPETDNFENISVQVDATEDSTSRSPVSICRCTDSADNTSVKVFVLQTKEEYSDESFTKF